MSSGRRQLFLGMNTKFYTCDVLYKLFVFCCGLILFLYHFIIIVFYLLLKYYWLKFHGGWKKFFKCSSCQSLFSLICWMFNFHLHVAKRALMFLFLEINELVSYLKTRYPKYKYVLLLGVSKVNDRLVLHKENGFRG